MLNVEITKDDVLKHIEDKLLKALESSPTRDEDGEYRGGTKFTPLLGEIVNLVADKIKAALWAEEKKSLQSRIQQTIDLELQKILNTTYQPVNHWGEKEGKPTTIREVFAERTRDFWLQKVDANGKATDSWNAKMTRAEFVAKSQLDLAFKEAMNSEIAVVVSAFREALTDTLTAQAKEHIESSMKKLIVAK